MRMRSVLLATAVLLAACGPPPGTPKRANSSKVAAGNPQAAMLWPSLLQHCLRTPECDPMSNFGEGAGEASGIEGSTTWWTKSDAEGWRTLDSFHGYRGQGGDAGRPLTPAETPRTLRARRDNRSWIVLEHGSHSVDEFLPTAIRLRSPHVVLAGVGKATSVRRQAEATEDKAKSFLWPDGRRGARLEILEPQEDGEAKSLLVMYAIGANAHAQLEDREKLKLPSTPWIYDVTLIPQKSPQSSLKLYDAIQSETTLMFRITEPGGGVILQDTIYTDGFQASVEASGSALGSSAAAPLTERCAPYVAEPMSFWAQAPDLSPAVRTCDSRTPEQRAQAATRQPVN